MRFKKGSTSLIAIDRVMYSASIVLNAVLVSVLLHQWIGQPGYEITYSAREMIDFGLLWSPSAKPPAKSASTRYSSPHYTSGLNIIPLSLVASKYLHILLIALSWQIFGSALNLAHWYVPMEISSLVVPCKYPSMPVSILYFQSYFLFGPCSSLDSSGPTTGVERDFVATISMLTVSRIRWIRNCWLMENQPLSNCSISTPRYLLSSPSSVNSNFSGPNISVEMNFVIVSLSRLRMIQSST